MKIFTISLFKLVLKIIYAPLKLLKTKNQIVYLSRQRNQKDIDIELLEKAINQKSPETKQVFRLKMIDDGISSKIKYLFYIVGDMYYLATSRVAILDTYSIPVSCLKHKKDLTVIQMWHALGAIKKFGYQAFGTKEGRDEKTSRALCMHKNYDYVLAPSAATGVFYKEAFNVDASKIKICPMPRVDYITDSKSPAERFFKLNPGLGDKKLVLYLPTFRKRDAYVCQQLKNEFDNLQEYQLLISKHPLSEMSVEEKYLPNGNFNSFELMKLADIIITDYSACAFEASLLMKPLYFFVPDFDEYMGDRGINVDVRQEMPSEVFYEADKLVWAIKENNYNFNELYSFKNKYVENFSSSACEIISTFIMKILGE